MPRICYVNGRYALFSQASVHVDDRAFTLSDGVYEVTAVRQGQLVDLDWHLDRLEYSLGELQIAMPMSRKALAHVSRQVVLRNRVSHGILYTQITRGVAPRDHAFPNPAVRPGFVSWAKSKPDNPASVLQSGVKVKSQRDLRWARRDIKSTSLLANVLMKQAALEDGGYESMQVDDDGMVTEGASTNFWMVDAEGTLVTRPLSNAILSGITRKRLIALAKDQGITVEERLFSLEEAKAAREVFFTSTTNFCMPVVQIDDHVIANGAPGSVAGALYSAYIEFAADAGLS
ncbi:MAG: D-amino-acid transaminase [Rhodospirillaceae bacterium]